MATTDSAELKAMEHADGSFLEHLVFCHDYAARYYPEHSPNVALLHSLKLAKKSIVEYSQACGHDLGYRIDWAS